MKQCFTSAALLLLLTGAALAAAPTYAPPTTGNYGAYGHYAVHSITFVNPTYPTDSGYPLDVSVYYPGNSINPALPTIFFLPGYTAPASNPADYSTLLRNMASQGYNVVFGSYGGEPVGSGTDPDSAPLRIAELESGLEAAVSKYDLNTAKIGYVGHSYGAGVLPAVIQHESAAGWGTSAEFAFSMAPGYAWGLPATQSIAMPANLNFVEEVYADDHTWADPRLAIDVFNNVALPASQKDFLTVYSDPHGTPSQLANHFLPTVATPSISLQDWAVDRHIDALAAYTFGTDPSAKDLALGTDATTDYMGKWSDGQAVLPLSATQTPNGSAYYSGFFWAESGSRVDPRNDVGVVLSAVAVPEPGTVTLGTIFLAMIALLRLARSFRTRTRASQVVP